MDYETVDHDKITAIANCLSNVELEWLMLHLKDRFNVCVNRRDKDGEMYYDCCNIKWVNLNGSLLDVHLDEGLDEQEEEEA